MPDPSTPLGSTPVTFQLPGQAPETLHFPAGIAPQEYLALVMTVGHLFAHARAGNADAAVADLEILYRTFGPEVRPLLVAAIEKIYAMIVSPKPAPGPGPATPPAPPQP